jgi:hypothetical protein
VEKPLSYWAWFTRGRSHKPGWQRLVDWWLVLHAAVGAGLALAVTLSLEEAAKAVLLPLAGVFVGMSFAWVGNAQALVQTAEIERLSGKNPAGFEVYVYSFQTAILVLLVTLGTWGVAGLGLFDRPCYFECPSWSYAVAKATLYALASFTLRVCWQVVAGAQLLLLYQRAVRNLRPK